MRVLIDADGCPVVDITVRLCKEFAKECIILCDTAHVFQKENAKTITVEKGADSVDFALVNLLKKGDVVITQDYGLAAMCLAKNALPVSQDGLIFTDKNISGLLESRHFAKKIRSSGGRLKGPSKRTPEQNKRFEETIRQLLSESK